MNNSIRLFAWGVILAVTTLGAAAGGHAASKKSVKDVPTDPAMAPWVKATMPGDAHKVLDPLAGKWNHTVRFWMNAGSAPQESQGTNENKWILGGRFLQQEAKGTAMGQPFEGLGFTGYDNVRGEYTAIWMDSMGTGTMMATGHYDAAAKTMKETGTCSDPMTGDKNHAFRGVTRFIDSDNYTWEMYTAGPDGKEYKALEIAYKRAR